MSFLEVLADLLSDRERVKRNQKSAQEIKEALRSKSPYPVFRSDGKKQYKKQDEIQKPSFTKKGNVLIPEKFSQKAKPNEGTKNKLSERGAIIVHLDILDDSGTVYSSIRPLATINCRRDEITFKVESLQEQLEDMGIMIRGWYAGSDGKDGVYTGHSSEIDFKDVPWNLFPKSTKKDFQGESEIEVMPVLKLKFSKLTGDELDELSEVG